MEQVATPSLSTPTTALLNSYLDFGSNETTSDAWDGAEADVFSRSFEQHCNARQEPCSANPSVLETSMQFNTKIFGEDYFATDTQDHGSGSISSANSQLRVMLGSSDESQNYPYAGSLLSPNSMAIIERNKMELWGFSQELGRAHHTDRSDSKILSTMEEYRSHITDDAEVTLEAKIITKGNRRQGRQTRKKVTDEKSRSEKRIQILERNRIAAGKCRKRKKATISTLEEKCHILKARNTAMRELACELVNEVESLKGAVQLHEAGKCAVEEDDGGLEVDEERESTIPEVDLILEEETRTSGSSNTEVG